MYRREQALWAQLMGVVHAKVEGSCLMSTSVTAQFWDAQFETWDIGEFDAEEREVFSRCIAFLGDVRNKDVLEIGCGLGKNSIALARLGANVTSVDISRTAIEKLNGYARQSGLPLKAFVC